MLTFALERIRLQPVLASPLTLSHIQLEAWRQRWREPCVPHLHNIVHSLDGVHGGRGKTILDGIRWGATLEKIMAESHLGSNYLLT